jgi:hypothetical protein
VRPRLILVVRVHVMKSIIFILILAPSIAIGCKCEPWSLESAAKESGHIAIVKLVSSRTIVKHIKMEAIDAVSADSKPELSTIRTESIEMTAQVQETIKGKSPKILKIVYQPGTTCSSSLQVNAVYVVFWNGSTATTDYCKQQPLLSRVPKKLLDAWRAAP